MPRFRISSLIFSMDEYVDYEDCYTPEDAKERWVEGVKEEVGASTARTMKRQVEVEKVTEDNDDTKEIE